MADWVSLFESTVGAIDDEDVGPGFLSSATFVLNKNLGSRAWDKESIAALTDLAFD